MKLASAPRVLGIAAGLLAGTIAALYFRGPFTTIDKAKRARTETNVLSMEVDDDNPSARTQIPDPGRRNAIKQLVEGAKKEQGWLTEFELTERSGKTLKSQDLTSHAFSSQPALVLALAKATKCNCCKTSSMVSQSSS